MEIKELLQKKTFVKVEPTQSEIQELFDSFHEEYNKCVVDKWKKSRTRIVMKMTTHPFYGEHEDRIQLFNKCADHKGLNDFAHYFNVMTKTSLNSTKTPPKQRVKVGSDKI